MQYLHSWELTYPLPKAVLKMVFLFPRWDILVPWRVDCIALLFGSLLSAAVLFQLKFRCVMLGFKVVRTEHTCPICRMDCGSIRGIADEVDCGISAFANLELKTHWWLLEELSRRFCCGRVAVG